ncbi:DUF1294 domain-containing protein [Poseidonibacter sp.]|uniref:DUF1294 domain-containing protein n=1 Tax=Poseidonibacter sp. TaxID=2321188 RepID=UPI003C74ED05
MSFLIYLIDKLQAIRNNNSNNISRVSERTLLLTSFVGGSIGALLSIVLFRHKIKKTSFMIKFTVILLIQVVVIYFIWRFI